MLSNEEFKAIVQKVFDFHTKRAPGIPIGVAMVDLALSHLGKTQGKINAIAETQACLSDVIQVMIGCTIGNRYLKIYNEIGRYALTLYDRDTGLGIRVSVNLNKIDPNKTPELYRFFTRTRDEDVKKGGVARAISCDKIINEFLSVNKDIFNVEKVQLKVFGKPPMLEAQICPMCKESFLQRNKDHTICDYCSGTNNYYTPLEKIL